MIRKGDILSLSKVDTGVAFLHNRNEQTDALINLVKDYFDSFEEDEAGMWRPGNPFLFKPDSLQVTITPNLHNFEFESKIKTVYKSYQRKQIKTKIVDYQQKNLQQTPNYDLIKEFRSFKTQVPFNDFEQYQACDESDNFETLSLLVRSLHSSHTNHLKQLKADLVALFDKYNTGIFDMNSVKDYKQCINDVKNAVMNDPQMVFPINSLKNISSGQFVFKSQVELHTFVKKFINDLDSSDKFQIQELNNGQIDPQDAKEKIYEQKDVNLVVSQKQFGLNLLFELRFQLEDIISIYKEMKLQNEVIEMSACKIRTKYFQEMWDVMIKKWNIDQSSMGIKWHWENNPESSNTNANANANANSAPITSNANIKTQNTNVNQVKTLFETGIDIKKQSEVNLPDQQNGKQWESQFEGHQCRCGCSFQKKSASEDSSLFKVFRQVGGIIRNQFIQNCNAKCEYVSQSFAESNKQMIKINEYKSFQFEDQEFRVIKQADGRVEAGFGLQIDADFLWIGEVCKASGDTLEVLRYELIQAGLEDVAKVVRVPGHQSFEYLNQVKDDKQNLRIYIIDSFKQFDFDY